MRGDDHPVEGEVDFGSTLYCLRRSDYLIRPLYEQGKIFVGVRRIQIKDQGSRRQVRGIGKIAFQVAGGSLRHGALFSIDTLPVPDHTSTSLLFDRCTLNRWRWNLVGLPASGQNHTQRYCEKKPAKSHIYRLVF